MSTWCSQLFIASGVWKSKKLKWNVIKRCSVFKLRPLSRAFVLVLRRDGGDLFCWNYRCSFFLLPPLLSLTKGLEYFFFVRNLLVFTNRSTATKDRLPTKFWQVFYTSVVHLHWVHFGFNIDLQQQNLKDLYRSAFQQLSIASERLFKVEFQSGFDSFRCIQAEVFCVW